MLCGPVNEFPLLFHLWQEFLITATPAFFFFTRNRLVKCHAKCKLINKQKDIMDVYYSALLCLTRRLIQIPGSGFLLGLGAAEACDWHIFIFTERQGCRRLTGKVVMELRSQILKF